MAKEKENLKNMNDGELAKELVHARESLRVIHFKSEGSRSKNVKEPANLKKKVARILTEINNRKQKK